MQMHNRLGSWVTLPCHIHLGGALKMIEMKSMHSSPSKVNDHIKDIRYNIIQASIKVAYDQTHDQTSISHRHRVSTKNTKISTKSKRDKEVKHSLSKPMIYTLLPLWQQVTKKFENA